MARQQTRGHVDYSLQLPDIAAPVEGKAGELTLQAGATAGAAAAIRGKAAAMSKDADTGALSFLGTTAIAAAKGKLEADLEKDINSSLSKLEGVGPEAVKAEANLDYVKSNKFATGVADQLTVLQEQSGMEEPQLVKDFMGDIGRYAEAQRQGSLDRGEVVARIGAAVKKYSALMPGWASDFRKIGAEMTGISNVDVYGIHAALTTKSGREKAAEAAQAAQLQAIKEIASEQGVLPNQVTPQMLQLHYQSKQLALATKNAENKLKLKDIGVKEADEAYGQIIDMKVSGAVVQMGQKFATLGALNADSKKAVESAEFGLKLSGELVMMGQQLEQEVRAMTRPQPGRTPLSVAAAETRIESIRKTVKELQDGVKHVEGRNMLAAIVKNSENNLNLLLNNFQLANPHITGLNKLGVLPSGLAQAWFSLPPEEFQKRFGKQLTDAFKGLQKAPHQHVNLMVGAALGQPVDLSAVSQADPALATATAGDMVHSINEWSKDPNPTAEKKNAFANLFAGFYSNSKNFNPGVPKNLDAAYRTLSSPDTQAFISKLDSAQRANALGPLVAGIESTIVNVGKSLQEQLAVWNNDSNLASRAGVQLKLQQNRLTGAFEVVQEGTAGRFERFTEMDSGAVGMGPGAIGRVSAARADARAAFTRAQTQANLLNKLVETYTIGVRSLSPENKVGADMVKLKAFDNITRGVAEPLVPGVREQLGVEGSVPKNTTEPAAPVSLDNTRVLSAIVKAERSDTVEGQKTSPAGARGKFQFMPETAKRFGLKVDPSTGVDERTDETKSGAAAMKYITVLHKMFEGDMAKVAAAYNAGEGSVQKAVAKATELGVENWQAFLPKPSETVPYIQRFLQSYTIKPITQGQR